MKDPECEVDVARKPSKAGQSKAYRERKKCDEWFEKQAERSRDQRKSMTDAQRVHYNEKAKERMKRMRERKRGGRDVKKATTSKPKSADNKKDLRDYKTMRMREYRANHTGNKKREIRRKDREYRRRKLEEKQQAREASAKEASAKRNKDRSNRYLDRLKQSNPIQYAGTVSKLIESATPKKKKELSNKYLYKESTHRKLIVLFQPVLVLMKKLGDFRVF